MSHDTGLTTKRCNSCDKTKPVTEFYRQGDDPTRLEAAVYYLRDAINVT